MSASVSASRSKADSPGFFSGGGWLALVLGLAGALACILSSAARAAPCDWPLWEHFLGRHVQADGRVIDFEQESHPSTSEGQAYAAFFALVADDREAFSRVWGWTRDNLMPGRDTMGLPAWRWGRRDGDGWGILDANSASDADLWLAYALLEAGRLWDKPDYAREGERILSAIAHRETTRIEGLGWMLLPAPVGFDLKGGAWRLNPSYLPLPLLRRAGSVSGDPRWSEIANNSVRILKEASPLGYAPDWLVFDPQKNPAVRPDIEAGTTGSYDAIRVYLWAGVTAPDDPLRPAMLEASRGMRDARLLDGVPERVDVASGEYFGRAPAGFGAALLPYRQDQTLTHGGSGSPGESPGGGSPLAYYDLVLQMFGLGWMEGRYRFSQNGLLMLPANGCHSASPAH